MKILMHACCMPCAILPLKIHIENGNDPTIFYYNPCIIEKENIKRKKEVIRIAKIFKFKFTEKKNIKADREIFFENSKKLKYEKEGCKRCERCFKQRLDITAKTAKEKNFDAFSTSLAISPYKNRKLIEKIAADISEKYKIKFLTDGVVEKFKDENIGYKKSVELSKEFNIYRQKFCGCEFSIQ